MAFSHWLVAFGHMSGALRAPDRWLKATSPPQELERGSRNDPNFLYNKIQSNKEMVYHVPIPNILPNTYKGGILLINF